MQRVKSNTKRRVILYGLFVLVTGALTYGGWFYTPHLGFDEDRTEFFGLVGEQDWDGAEALLVAMGHRYSDDVRVPLLRAYMAECRGRLGDAKDIYLGAVNKAYNDAQRAELLVTVADIERRLGDSEAAERRLSSTVETFGESYRSRHLRVLLLVDKHAYDEALGEVGRMAEENPVNPHARSLRKQIRQLKETSVSGTEQALTVGTAAGN